jgi:tRNA1Val (adenine37-N6)-methyltransferase
MGKSGNRQVQFKQFTVRDERCAMKVGTDALLLGAWCDVEEATSVLDIGSGSAIVTLMIAQRAKGARVIAVELERIAFGQGCENVAQSPFMSQVQCIHQRIQEFSKETRWEGSFDVVVSNPPFFHGKPKSPDAARNLARHDDTLALSDLLDSAKRCMRPLGRFMLVWPEERRVELFEAAQRRGLSLAREMTIQGSPEHVSTRFLSEWSYHGAIEPKRDAISIEKGRRIDGQVVLTDRYVKLMSPYVLALD